MRLVVSVMTKNQFNLDVNGSEPHYLNMMIEIDATIVEDIVSESLSDTSH